MHGCTENLCYSYRSMSRPNHTQTMLHGAGRLECPEQPSEAVANDASSMKPTSAFYTNRAMKISTLFNPMKVLSSICCTQSVGCEFHFKRKRAGTKEDGVKDHRQQVVPG